MDASIIKADASRQRGVPDRLRCLSDESQVLSEYCVPQDRSQRS